MEWQNVDDKPNTQTDSLIHAKLELYPNIHVASKVLLTMPVTSATAEISFSALKRIKTYLRSTMIEDRLSGLSMMHVHLEIELDIAETINTFASDGNQKFHLVFPY